VGFDCGWLAVIKYAIFGRRSLIRILFNFHISQAKPPPTSTVLEKIVDYSLRDIAYKDLVWLIEAMVCVCAAPWV